MKHHILADELGHHGDVMANAIQACVHCGFCLPSCPTYQVLEHEADSPRGRIVLMKQVLEGETDVDGAHHHIDSCLGCLACETACPSGVRYRELISPFRALSRADHRRSLGDRLRRWVVLKTLPYPDRFRAAVRLGRLAIPIKRFLPRSIRSMVGLLPEQIPRRQRLPERTPAIGRRRARVALLTGCVQQVIAPEIGQATINVLSRNGVEVLVPRGQACCGALAWHVGAGDRARGVALANLRVFEAVIHDEDIDAIVTNAAGCGSGMQEYPLIFAGTRWAGRARLVADRVRDVSEFLDHVGITPPPPLRRPLRLVYHDACHLAHAQSVRSSPRALLRMVPGLEVIEVGDGELCCGSAGTYNLDHPEIAAELGRRKAEKISEYRPDLVAAGNIGCLVQMRTYLANLPKPPTVLHTLQVLQMAYEG